MSYSRWSNSCWYTFSTVNKVDDESTLEVNCEQRYPLSQLIEGKEGVLQFYRDLRFDRNPLNYQGEGEPPKDHFTEAEIQELSGIIDDFVADHREEYKP